MATSLHDYYFVECLIPWISVKQEGPLILSSRGRTVFGEEFYERRVLLLLTRRQSLVVILPLSFILMNFRTTFPFFVVPPLGATFDNNAFVVKSFSDVRFRTHFFRLMYCSHAICATIVPVHHHGKGKNA